MVGGMERQCEALCKRLARLGVEVEVWTRRVVPGSPYRDETDGVVVQRLRPGGLGRRGEYGWLPTVCARLWRERSSYDIIHVYGTGYLALAALAVGRWLGVPVIMRPALAGSMTRFIDSRQITAGSTPTRWLKAALPPETIRRRVVTGVDRVVAISGEIADECRRWGVLEERLVRIDNGVDTQYFAPAETAEKRELRSRLALPQDATIVLYAGRFVRRKGLLDLVTAWSRLDQRDARLILLGSGAGQTDSCETEMDQLARNAGLEESIVRVGLVDDPLPWLQSADIFVLPSYQEGVSNAALEALACGLAVLASQNVAGPELLEHMQTAVVTRAGDVAGLTSGLRLLIASPRLRSEIGARARRRIEQGYDIQRSVARHLELYTALTQQR
jgi:glycosyltransferase involved in cell wall biosynthesis